jgi:hypothetical protein
MSTASEDLNTFGLFTQIPIASKLQIIHDASLKEYSDKEYKHQMKVILMLINEVMSKRSDHAHVSVQLPLGQKTKARLTELGYFFVRPSWKKEETRVCWGGHSASRHVVSNATEIIE